MSRDRNKVVPSAVESEQHDWLVPGLCHVTHDWLATDWLDCGLCYTPNLSSTSTTTCNTRSRWSNWADKLNIIPIKLILSIFSCETETITRLIAVTHLIQIVGSPIGSVITCVVTWSGSTTEQIRCNFISISTALVALCCSALLNLTFIFQLNISTLLQRNLGQVFIAVVITRTAINTGPWTEPIITITLSVSRIPQYRNCNYNSTDGC